MRIRRLATTTSTNDEAVRRAKEGGEEGEVFIANHQTAGRGRMGRSWESPEGKNLYLSLLLRPALPPTQVSLLTLVAGASVHETLVSFLTGPLQEELTIKWPNDVYWGNKKIAGILSESGITKNRVEWVVCGIGINLNCEAADFSPEVGLVATSVRIALGHEVDRGPVTARFIEIFDRRYLEFCRMGPAETISYCEKHSYLAGQRFSGQDGNE